MEPMIKIDRTAVDKAIEKLEGMFTDTMKVLTDYIAENDLLVNREEVIKNRLAQLQNQHTNLLLDREEAKGNPSEYISISSQLAKIDEEVKILLSLKEQLKEEFIELKKKYMPIIRGTYSKDSAKRNEYFNVGEAVTHVGVEINQAISDYKSEITKQDSQVMKIIRNEFLDDKEIMNESWDDPDRRRSVLNFKRTFEFDRHYLSYEKEIKLQ